jgi:hypothetical protein
MRLWSILQGTDRLPVMYIKKKGSIAGPMFKLPFMGPFIQALNPKFDAYLVQFASGPLSCISVFHKYIVAFQPIKFLDLETDPFVPQICRPSCRS